MLPETSSGPYMPVSTGEIVLPDEYPARIISLNNQLQAALHDRILPVPGPTYHTNVPDSKLSINTFFMDYFLSNEHGGGKKRRSLYIIAQDSKGEIVGHRYVDYDRELPEAMVPVESPQGLVAEGAIFTEKGHGYAIPIDLVLMDILQREANNRGVDVVWKVTNANRRTLEKVRSSNPPDSEIAQEQDLENQRWNGIWGERGLLGITWGEGGANTCEYGTKRFSPNSRQADMPWNIAFSRDIKTRLMHIEREERPTVLRRMISDRREQETYELIAKIKYMAKQHEKTYRQSLALPAAAR